MFQWYINLYLNVFKDHNIIIALLLCMFYFFLTIYLLKFIKILIGKFRAEKKQQKRGEDFEEKTAGYSVANY